MTEEQKEQKLQYRKNLTKIAMSLWSNQKKYSYSDFESALRLYELAWMLEREEAEKRGYRKGVKDGEFSIIDTITRAKPLFYLSKDEIERFKLIEEQ